MNWVTFGVGAAMALLNYAAHAGLPAPWGAVLGAVAVLVTTLTQPLFAKGAKAGAK